MRAAFALSAVRAGLSFVKLDAGARAALQSVRGAEVGVYQLPSGAKPPDRAAMLAAADAAMAGRGWDRVVGVMDGRDLVAVYLPDEIASARRMKCCVMVFDGREMVVVSARANLEPLLEYALAQPDIAAEIVQEQRFFKLSVMPVVNPPQSMVRMQNN